MTRISVVIPALDEERRILGAVRSARRALGDDPEVVVADGGSRDRTVELASAEARVVVASEGRGAQLDAGARASSGDVLVFLHADTRLEPGSRPAILEALSRPGVVGGCFRFAVEPPAGRLGRYRLLEEAVRLRTRLFHTATGDQAIFATRDAYRAAGGFPRYPLFEDVVLVRRLKRIGRFRPVRAAARTSRRRWERAGFWRTVLTHLGLRLAFLAGVSPRRLARWYGSRPADRPAPPGPRPG